jgi:hypothetical protein
MFDLSTFEAADRALLALTAGACQRHEREPRHEPSPRETAVHRCPHLAAQEDARA